MCGICMVDQCHLLAAMWQTLVMDGAVFSGAYNIHGGFLLGPAWSFKGTSNHDRQQCATRRKCDVDGCNNHDLACMSG